MDWMDFTKHVLPWIVAVIGVIVGYVNLQGKVASNAKDIEKHDKLLTSGHSGGAPFLTEPEHDKLQLACQITIDARIKNIEGDIGEMRDTMKEGDECRKEAREENSNQFASLRKEFNDHYTDMAVLVAGIKADIKNIYKNGKL